MVLCCCRNAEDDIVEKREKASEFDENGLQRCRPPTLTPQQLPEVTVQLNVYSLLKQNTKLSKVGMGVYHSGVVIYGIEWGYGEAMESTNASGLFCVYPGQAAGTLHRTIYLGITTLSPQQVDTVLHRLENEWRSEDYHILHRNCNHFAQRFCDLLSTVQKLRVPSWCNRAARVCDRIVPRKLATYVHRMIDEEPPKAPAINAGLRISELPQSVIPRDWYLHPAIAQPPRYATRTHAELRRTDIPPPGAPQHRDPSPTDRPEREALGSGLDTPPALGGAKPHLASPAESSESSNGQTTGAQTAPAAPSTTLAAASHHSRVETPQTVQTPQTPQPVGLAPLCVERIVEESPPLSPRSPTLPASALGDEFGATQPARRALPPPIRSPSLDAGGETEATPHTETPNEKEAEEKGNGAGSGDGEGGESRVWREASGCEDGMSAVYSDPEGAETEAEVRTPTLRTPLREQSLPLSTRSSPTQKETRRGERERAASEDRESEKARRRDALMGEHRSESRVRRLSNPLEHLYNKRKRSASV